MIINTHAGHNPDGKIACGAVGLVKESTVAREINKEVITFMKQLGHTVHDCTVDNGKNKNDVLKKIVAKCNIHNVNVDVSVHLNSGRDDIVGDNSIGGTEILVYSDDSEVLDMAIRVAQEFKERGFRLRSDNTSPAEGVKVRKNLYVLKHTNSPAMLIETFFCDDADDVKLYQIHGAKGIATAIVEGITGQNITNKNDINKDGRVDLTDANEALKQGIGIIEGNATLEDANNILKEAIGITTKVSSTSTSIPASTPVSTNKPANVTNNTTNTIDKKTLIKLGQKHSNNFVEPNIGVDGIRGNETKEQASRVLQHAMNLDYGSELKVDGLFQTKSKKALGKHYVKRGETQYMVTALEILLYMKGYNPNGVECPGKFGKGLEECVKQYQRDNGFEITGIADRKVFLSLLK